MAKKTTKKAKEITDKYILVIGQVGGCKELDNSEIRGMQQLDNSVYRNAPKDTKVLFRRDPLATEAPHPLHTHLERFPLPDNAENQGAQSIKDALSGALFVITINSISIIEAIAAGIPCLAFGPCTGIDEGAVHQTSLKTLKKDIAEMVKGWKPSEGAINRFLGTGENYD